MTEEQKRAAYNAVVSALITLGVTDRDALYAAEAAVQCLSKWDAQLLSHAAAEQRRIDENHDREELLAYAAAYTGRGDDCGRLARMVVESIPHINAARLTPAFEAGRASCTCAQAQRRIDDEDRAGYLTEREAYKQRLRADISPEEAAEDYMGDPDEWDDQ